jgi:hypothetical protein
MEPSADRVKEWRRLLEMAHAHSITQPPFNPSNQVWKNWRNTQRKLEQDVYNANPYRK